MIPYLLPEIPGELFYSRIVRTMKLCTGTLDAAHISVDLLGNQLRRLGVRLPQHGRRLLEQIPNLYALTEDDLLRNSLYPVAAPFIEHTQRDSLRRECIESQSPQVMRWFRSQTAKHDRHLRYCPQCAREDQAQGTQKHWRTMHQYPYTSACPCHGIELVSAPAAILGTGKLHDPNEHILPSGRVTRPASQAAQIVARDLRWILEENTLIPGRNRMQAALRMALSQVPTYQGKNGSLRGSTVHKELESLFGSPATKNRSELLARFSRETIGNILFNTHRVPALYEYSLLAALIQLPLPELMARAVAMPE